jgi:hypothetical protein
MLLGGVCLVLVGGELVVGFAQQRDGVLGVGVGLEWLADVVREPFFGALRGENLLASVG